MVISLDEVKQLLAEGAIEGGLIAQYNQDAADVPACLLCSIAISLKRIADIVDRAEKGDRADG